MSAELHFISLSLSTGWRKFLVAGDVKPPPLSGHSMHSLGKTLFVLFGEAHGVSSKQQAMRTLSNDVFAMDMSRSTWTKMSPTGSKNHVLPAPRRDHAACSMARKIVICGGTGKSGGTTGTPTTFKDLWVLSLECNTWESIELKGNALIGRSHHSICFDSNASRVLIFGGICEPPHPSADTLSKTGHVRSQSVYCSTQVWSVDVRTGICEELLTIGQAPPRLHSHRACTDPGNGHLMYVLGGRRDDTRPNSNIYILDSAAAVWTELKQNYLPPSLLPCFSDWTSDGPGALYSFAMASHNNTFILFGGACTSGISGTRLSILRLGEPAAAERALVKEEHDLETLTIVDVAAQKKFQRQLSKLQVVPLKTRSSLDCTRIEAEHIPNLSSERRGTAFKSSVKTITGQAAARAKLEPLILLKKKQQVQQRTESLERRDLWIYQKQHKDPWLLYNPKPSTAAKTAIGQLFTRPSFALADKLPQPKHMAKPWTLARLRDEERQAREAKPAISPIGKFSPSGRPYSRVGPGIQKTQPGPSSQHPGSCLLLAPVNRLAGSRFFSEDS